MSLRLQATLALVFILMTVLLGWLLRYIALTFQPGPAPDMAELIAVVSVGALAILGLLAFEKPVGGFATLWTLVGTGLIYGLGPVTPYPSRIYVPAGLDWSILRLMSSVLDMAIGRAPLSWPATRDLAAVVGIFFVVPLLPLALRRSEDLQRSLRPSNRHEGGNRYRSRETVFGDADWGTWRAMKPAIADAAGIVLGEDYDPRSNRGVFRTDDPGSWGQGGSAPLVTMRTSYGSGHVLVVSGAGGGKSSAIVIPTCLTYRRPVVVVDPDGEILRVTRAAREAMGQRIRVIRPGEGFDMLGLLAPHLDASSMAYAHLAGLMVETDRMYSSDAGDYFKAEAVNIIASLLEHFRSLDAVNPLREIIHVMTKDESAFKDEITRIAEGYSLNHMIRLNLGSYRNVEPRFFQSFQTTVRQALKWVPYREYLSMFSAEPEGAPPLLDDRTDIFIQVSKSDMKENPTLMRLVLGSILYVADNRDPELPPQERLVIVDEAAAIGRMTIFDRIRDTARKKKLHLMMIFQSQGQIEELYGRTGLKSWMNGTAARVFAGIEDLEECRALSDLVGSYTVDVDGESRSTSSRPGLFTSTTRSVSTSSSIRAAKLITPEQVRTLPGDALIVLFANQPPLLLGKAYWFRRPEWRRQTGGAGA
jgi:type IV secretion system protein VirD4